MISPHYDSLIAKVIAHGPERAGCVQQLAAALDGTRIEGVATNVDLLAAVLDEPAFVAGELHTGFLEDYRMVERLADVPDEVLAAAAGARSLAPHAPVSDAWRLPVPWRIGRIGEPTRWRTGRGTCDALTTLSAGGGQARVETMGRTFDVRLLGGGEHDGWVVEVEGGTAIVRPVAAGRRVETATWRGRRHRLALASPPAIGSLAPEQDEPDALSAPMPGRIARLHVAEGDHVVANAPLLILEAMKMEHIIAAAAPGRVTRIHVAEGDQVARGDALVDLDVAEGGPG